MTRRERLLQTAAATIASVSVGFYLGLQFAGRLAYQSGSIEPPAWVSTVQTVGNGTLVLFAVCIAIVALVEWKFHTEGQHG